MTRIAVLAAPGRLRLAKPQTINQASSGLEVAIIDRPREAEG